MEGPRQAVPFWTDQCLCRRYASRMGPVTAHVPGQSQRTARPPPGETADRQAGSNEAGDRGVPGLHDQLVGGGRSGHGRRESVRLAGKDVMLYEFVTTYRDAIIQRAREKLTARPWPAASAQELDNGVPLFLTQLAETLRSESSDSTPTRGAIGSTATRHGADLLALGFSVSQVVHDYGDICQAVTELAIEQNAPISTEEFKTLNGCLDTAIAEAVTEHARITAESVRAHGGDIHIRNIPGKGCVFSIDLPLAAQEVAVSHGIAP